MGNLQSRKRKRLGNLQTEDADTYKSIVIKPYVPGDYSLSDTNSSEGGCGDWGE